MRTGMDNEPRRKRKKRAFRSLQSLLRQGRHGANDHTLGNGVRLLENGGDFFPALFQAMDSACATLYAEFYIIKADRTGQAFARALTDAVARGVRVALIYDYVGCYETPSSYFRQLQQAGVHCLPFNVPAFTRLHWLDRRNHRKVVVMDGAVAFVGGINIGDEYAGYADNPKSWRDVGLRLEGPAAARLQEMFRTTWQQETGQVLPTEGVPVIQEGGYGDADIMIVDGKPHHTRSTIRSAFRLAMAGARASIRIMTPYFVPGPRVVRGMLRAFRAGVRVELILPSISDVPLVKLASRAYLTPLLREGVAIYERQGTTLHAKVMLIDDNWVTLGSANLDQRSFYRNYELNVVIASHAFGIQVGRMLDQDLTKSRRVVLDEYERRTWFERLLIWLLSPLSRFL